MPVKAPNGRTLLIALAAIVACGCALLLVGPRALGGPTSILAVSGNSMEPRIKAGDLILVRSGGPYHVGQIVAYHNIPASATFLHRIIAVRGTGFAMKGDNNGWIDPGTAQPQQILGSLWIRIPGAGSAFKWVATPLHGALLAAASAFLIALQETFRRRKRPRAVAADPGDEHGAPVLAIPGVDLLRNDATGPWTWRPPPRASLPVDAILKTTLAAALVGAAACAFLGVISFSRPASIPERPVQLYRQSGTMSYQATAPPSPVYPTGRVSSPSPLYLHLVKRATFSFGYRVTPIGRTAVSGTAQMRLMLHGSTGWTRALALTPPRPFRGRTVTLEQRISVAQVRSLLATIQSLTASPDSYSLLVAPVVVTHGSAGGRPFVRRFTPHFTFDLSDAEMTLAGAPTSPSAISSALTNSGVETAPASGSQRTQLSVGPLQLPVTWWRLLTLLLGTALLGTAAAAAVAMHRRLAGRGEPALIAAKYRSMLVPLALAPVPGERHVTVRSFDDLVRVARRHDTTIMHHASADGAEHYLVLADGVTFRYRSNASAAFSEPRGDVRSADSDVA